MAVLYGGVMKIDPKNPRWEERDRFILSKGHGTLGTILLWRRPDLSHPMNF